MSRIAGLVVLAVLMALVAAFPAGAVVPEPAKTPTAVGSGGSASTVDPLATQTAIDVLRSGGNAVDAAVAAAGVLGVTEPFSCGIGGGGFMVVYDARRHKVDTIDSREAAPARMKPNSLEPYKEPSQFTEARVSGLSVGVPGTVAGWETALKRYGSRPLRSLLRPAEVIGREGFVIDKTFNGQVNDNKELFDDFTASRQLYLTAGDEAKPVGDVQTNPDLADTYERIGDDPDRFYRGPIARDIVQTVQHPPESPDSDRPHEVHPGKMTPRDLKRYDAIRRDPTRVNYRGFDVFGMGPPSSGGSTVGEALNILEALPPTANRTTVLHRYLEASKLAYADRNAYLGDPAYFDVPLRGLLSDPFARDRSGSIHDDRTLSTPQPAGNPYRYEHGHGHGHGRKPGTEEKARSTTHLTVADRWGNIVSYTFTIEQIGGNGMVVPGRGFLLNNELTDFNFVPGTANSPDGGKRPRSSMAPTIVFDDGEPEVALGSPGGATIITSVLQTLVNYIDFRQSLPDAVAAPRASQRNSEPTPAEPAFIAQDGPPLQALGHSFTVVTPNPPAEIGAVEAIRFLPDGTQEAVAEPTRRGGGSAMVVNP
ncbi:MAG: gamma-glutamyltranspeptidase / glutathione hydrolase [Solirubrobacteraceae bacterium]|jgi:gamma-glutamyltranspeptidase/glutathione hydrolase|nr:gamma-glutamyltranspeptidase / glutathione hydrolase [Solirubrobacteraceae bacterium]